MKTAKTRMRSLSEKIRSVRSHISSMEKHAAKAAVAGRMSAISAWHVGRGLAITRISADMGSEWPAFCLAKFGMPARRASNLMKLSEAFASPDDIPDECRSITSAVKAARAAIRGMKPVCLKRVSNKCIEKGMKDWVVKNWESLDRGERSKLGIPYHSQDEVWAEVPVHGRISGKPASGIIDLLFRHVVKNH